MSRLSFRPRPLDIHKKLPIVKSVKDLEDDETAGATRTSQLVRLTLETENEVHETQHGEDGFMVPGLPPLPHKSALVKRVEDEHITGQHSNLAVNSLDLANGHARIRPGSAQTPPVTDAMPMMEVADQTKREQKRNQALQPRGWISRRDPLEPVLLFTKHLDSERLAAAGIVPPSDPPIQNGATTPPYRFQGRIGRGGRIVFDRWNPLTRTPLGCDRSPFSAENLQPPPPRL